MSTVRFNVSRMFADIEPWDVSNSVANLGPRAGELTWGNALRIAENHAEWLLSPLADVLDYSCSWARETGAWDQDEIDSWNDVECLALLVQNVASDMRLLGSDDNALSWCAENYAVTDWEAECEFPTTHLSVNSQNEVLGEVCS